ncbi:MAG: sugar ABC transporter ATP-binding protein [Trueperaceae bacterium]|nr:sugar ABC transporter ATP-binding protein [Trueperaceae bacterium]
MRGIVKRFGAVTALDGVDFSCTVGEIHALVGENGAGKSTLMKILGGAYTADAGDVTLFGSPVTFRHPLEAQQAGISVIHQEFNLLPHRTVMQNIYLGREPTRFGMIDDRALRRQVGTLLRELGVEHLVDPFAMVRDLSIAQQQMVEIAKAMSFDARVIVMDEPTAALSGPEVDVLFGLMRDVRERGVTVVYISHRFREIFEIADRVTVIKDGQHVDTRRGDELDGDELVRLMVGRDLADFYPPRANPDDLGDVVVRVRGGGNHVLHDIDLEVRAGEVLGIAGLQGAGRTELARALFGVDPFTTGDVTIKGKPARLRSPREAVRLGLGFITEDRKREGLSLRQPIYDNVVLAYRALRPALARLGGERTPGHPSVRELTTSVDLRASGPQQEVQFLSGGNQQKVVLAKWLATAEDLLIFDEPTRGIDVNGKASIHHLVRDAARDGMAVIMISSELLEVIGMSDRIVVMREGRIAGELPGGASEAEIMALATHGGGDPRARQTATATAERGASA